MILKQICGIPMGSHMSPSLGDIRMFQIILKKSYNYNYCRFRIKSPIYQLHMYISSSLLHHP